MKARSPFPFKQVPQNTSFEEEMGLSDSYISLNGFATHPIWPLPVIQRKRYSHFLTFQLVIDHYHKV
ncbi:hypothetical protein SAMN04488513_102616 [Pseudozobellia thermophila]|uniref:Uncharacterized protein n=1 Tax=Pseudozobellia thermophila TaxID=192903 RepID=A0A1M6FZR3_9FLAO|nr:hypothetical protein SAMN04488513_102616 [Pseudozobellia thermophila]